MHPPADWLMRERPDTEGLYPNFIGARAMSEMVTPIKAAHVLGGNKPLSLRTLASWRKAGTGPAFVRVGRNIRYPLDALQAFIAARTTQ